MKSARVYRFLLRLVIVGSILSFGRCVMLGLRSMATSMGGHGQEAVLDAKNEGNKAEQFFFLSMALIVVAVALAYVTGFVEKKAEK